MKELNSKFGFLHGLSSLANLSAVIALGFHGLYLGNNIDHWERTDVIDAKLIV